jgi:hypothetical protein
VASATGLGILFGAVVSAVLAARVIQLDANLAQVERELATVPRPAGYAACGSIDWSKHDRRRDLRCMVDGYVITIPAREPAVYRDLAMRWSSVTLGGADPSLARTGPGTARVSWVNPPELQAELEQLRGRTEYLRVIAQILVAESNTKRVELPRPDPWVAWPAIVVPDERKAAGR